MTEPVRIPMLSFILRGGTRAVLLKAGLLIAIIAFADWKADKDVTLGFLYLFPMLMVGSVLKRWQIAMVAALCTLLAEIFDSFDFRPSAGIPRDILVFAAFLGMGLFVYEVVRSRQAALTHLKQIESESEARRAAEEQLKVLVDSSPVAIFTADAYGTVLQANDAAHRLFALSPGALPGRSIRRLSSIAGECSFSRTKWAILPDRDAMPGDSDRTAKLSWPISGFPPTGPAWDRGWPPWWWIPPKICAIAKSTVSTSCWLPRVFWWAPCPTKFATSAAPLPWCMKISRATTHLPTIRILRRSAR